MSLYYDLEGNAIGREEYFALLEQRRAVRSDDTEYSPANDHPTLIGSDHVGDAWVSTVWLGLDHSSALGGPPIIFETMVFGGEYDMFYTRYPDKVSARAGHERIVASLRDGTWDDDQ